MEATSVKATPRSAVACIPQATRNFPLNKQPSLQHFPSESHPLSQHIGAPCKPTVVIGQEVKKGERIGETGGFVSRRCTRPFRAR